MKHLRLIIVIIILCVGVRYAATSSASRALDPTVGQRDAYRDATAALAAEVVALRDSLAVERRADTLGIDAEMLREIYASADRHGLDRELWLRLVEHESSFRPEVVSYRRAYGLSQVRLPTARTVDPGLMPDDLLDPTTNLEVGASYLARLIRRYDGDVDLALAAYNAGPTRIDRDPDVRRHVIAVYADRINLR